MLGIGRSTWNRGFQEHRRIGLNALHSAECPQSPGLLIGEIEDEAAEVVEQLGGLPTQLEAAHQACCTLINVALAGRITQKNDVVAAGR